LRCLALPPFDVLFPRTSPQSSLCPGRSAPCLVAFQRLFRPLTDFDRDACSLSAKKFLLSPVPFQKNTDFHPLSQTSAVTRAISSPDFSSFPPALPSLRNHAPRLVLDRIRLLMPPPTAQRESSLRRTLPNACEVRHALVSDPVCIFGYVYSPGL